MRAKSLKGLIKEATDEELRYRDAVVAIIANMPKPEGLDSRLIHLWNMFRDEVILLICKSAWRDIEPRIDRALYYGKFFHGGGPIHPLFARELRKIWT